MDKSLIMLNIKLVRDLVFKNFSIYKKNLYYKKFERNYLIMSKKNKNWLRDEVFKDFSRYKKNSKVEKRNYLMLNKKINFNKKKIYKNFKFIRTITFVEWLAITVEKHPTTKKAAVPFIGFFSFCFACDYLYYRSKEYELIDLDIELKRKELAKMELSADFLKEIKD